MFKKCDKTQVRHQDYLQAESPYPRQSHSLVNSTKPGALVSPLPARQETESEQTVINKSSDREGALLKYDGNEVL